MAKGSKHSPALFEVVHGKKHFNKSDRDSALRTPSWWFKGRKRMTDSGALAPAGAGTAVDEPPPFDDDGIPVSAADPTENPAFLAARDRERNGHAEPAGAADDADAPADPMAIPAALTTTPRNRRRSAFQFVVDRDRHELFVRVRYTTAVVAGVSVAMLVALAYITGRHTGRGPSRAAASPSAEEIAAGPVEKGVLDVNRRGGGSSFTLSQPGAGGAASAPAAAPRGAGIGGVGQQVAGAGPARTPSTPAALVNQAATAPAGAAGAGAGAGVGGAGRLPRTVNLQYVIVQSYPAKEKQMADDACDALNRAGIPCTVEKGVAGYTSADWYCVVGTTGFDRASGPAYERYLAEIEKVNDKYAGKSRFKRFTPGAVRWRGPGGAN